MPVTISGKQILRMGALIAAISAIGGGGVAIIAVAKPILETDPPPLANQERVLQEDKKITLLAQNFQMMQQHQERADQTQLFLANGFWTQQLATAQARLHANPNDIMARQNELAAQQQISVIQRLLASQRP